MFIFQTNDSNAHNRDVLISDPRKCSKFDCKSRTKTQHPLEQCGSCARKVVKNLELAIHFALPQCYFYRLLSCIGNLRMQKGFEAALLHKVVQPGRPLHRKNVYPPRRVRKMLTNKFSSNHPRPTKATPTTTEKSFSYRRDSTNEANCGSHNLSGTRTRWPSVR